MKLSALKLIPSISSLLVALSAAPKKPSMTWPPASETNYVDVDKFDLDPDLEITLWAKSPLFYNPTNMSIDPK